MKTALPRQKPNPSTTPATTPATNAGAPSDRVRAPLALVEPSPESPPRGHLKSFEGDPKADAKELLQKLEFHLARYPQFTSILMLAIEPMRAEVRRRPKSDRDLVFDVITAFDSVPLEELLGDTHLSAERVCAVLLDLVEVGLVDCRTSGRRSGTKLDPSFKALLGKIFARADHRHLKGDYRAEYLFCHKLVPAGSDFTGPARESSQTQAMSEFLQS
ncbi:MAG: hypothetical protein LC803_16680 [Acidobacteria bacterium]|nr:hypothetical protein [Acidobacteriota bacterium]